MALDYAEAVRLIRKGRRAEQRGKVLEGCITGLITQTVAVLAGGFWLMLAADVIHKHWIPALPTVGYWWAVLVVMLLKGVFSNTPSAKDKT